MKCPYCGSLETKVNDSRLTSLEDAIRRRRECLDCHKRFTTFERVEETPITVIKKGGGREPFDRSKLLDGVRRATIKRHVSAEQVEQLVSEVENELRNQFKYEVTSKKLGEMILERLLNLDKVAYVRFASVYREFQDLEEFNDELERLRRSVRKKSSRQKRKRS
jgi:transcriptional repressor NrdR